MKAGKSSTVHFVTQFFLFFGSLLFKCSINFQGLMCENEVEVSEQCNTLTGVEIPPECSVRAVKGSKWSSSSALPGSTRRTE